MTAREVPSLAEVDWETLAWERLPALIGSALAHQPDDFYAAWQRGDLFGQCEAFPFNDDGFMRVMVAGVDVVRIHYTRLLPDIPMDLAANPPERVDGE